MGVWKCSCEPLHRTFMKMAILKFRIQEKWSFCSTFTETISMKLHRNLVNWSVCFLGCPFFHAARVSTSVDQVYLVKQLLCCPGEVMGGRTALEDTCRWRFTHKPKRIGTIGVKECGQESLGESGSQGWGNGSLAAAAAVAGCFCSSFKDRHMASCL